MRPFHDKHPMSNAYNFWGSLPHTKCNNLLIQHGSTWFVSFPNSHITSRHHLTENFLKPAQSQTNHGWVCWGSFSAEKNWGNMFSSPQIPVLRRLQFIWSIFAYVFFSVLELSIFPLWWYNWFHVGVIFAWWHWNIQVNDEKLWFHQHVLDPLGYVLVNYTTY